jgi:transposase
VSEERLSEPPAERIIRRRTRRDPKPRFKPDVTGQLDMVLGCPAFQVPEDHLARAVRRIVARFDLSKVEAKYSSLGRRGYAPANLLAIWVYASLVGIHHATKVARALKTDAALRLLSGGYSVSRSVLNDFRQQQGTLFAELIEQTVAMAQSEGLLHLDDLAADSMRLRAHASTKAVRTLSRSKKRLEELASVDESALSNEQRAKHRAQLQKHTSTVVECEKRKRPNILTTNPSAALMKFPDGAGLPGHRVSTMAAGMRARLIVGVLVTPDTNDYGMLESVVGETRRLLGRIGVADDAKLQVAADAGYCAQADLAFAERVRDRTDILVDGTHEPTSAGRFFGRDRFVIHPDRSASCPAGRRMNGPIRHSEGRMQWTGVGCTDCSLRARCTEGKYRSFTANPELDRLRAAMRARMSAADGKARYNRRIATVEPVFSNIESTMGYRRASSRWEATVIAEVMLKVLAHNVSRLLAAKPLSCVYYVFLPDGSLRLLQPNSR